MNMCCDNCEDHIIGEEHIGSITPIKKDGTRGSLVFCTEGCYEEYHENNYVLVDNGKGQTHYTFKEEL